MLNAVIIVLLARESCAAEYLRLGDCGGGGCMPEDVCPVLILILRHLLLVAVPARVDARAAMGRPTVSALTFLLSSLSTSFLLLIYSLWMFLFTFGLSGIECPVYFSCFF